MNSPAVLKLLTRHRDAQRIERMFVRRSSRSGLLLLGSLFVLVLSAQDTEYPRAGQVIPGPANPAESQKWLRDVRHWREERKVRIAYEDTEYQRPALAWTRTNFIQTLLMAEDSYFYDLRGRRYTVDRYLNDLEQRYGGIDSVVIWPEYPNLGIDSRNQHDFIADMPGGIAGMRKVVEEFHRRGVRVFLPINPWDRGTREDGPLDLATVKLFADIGADGAFGDTFESLPRTYRTLSDGLGHPLALEPEGDMPEDEPLVWNSLSWGNWKFKPGYKTVPSISRVKWIEPRHMVHVSNSWGRNCTDDLQHMFFNGAGFNSWENIFGIWNQIPPRDAEALRRISKIERALAGYLVSPGWEPHTPVIRENVFASKWPGSNGTLWTIVNRNSFGVSGRQIELAAQAGQRYFDVWHGVELKPEDLGTRVGLNFEMEPLGFGAVLATNNPDPALEKLLAEMSTLSERRLADFSDVWTPSRQAIVEIPATGAAHSAPAGMTLVPAISQFVFRVSGVEVEGADAEGVDVQYPWEESPRRQHLHTLSIPAFYMDTDPVTNADFARFLLATRYRPEDDHNFLKDWKDGAPPSGWATRPVTWVSLEDARAYAKWAGKRLPHEWEWQYAAQGSDGRIYPWGNDWKPSAVPVADHGQDMRGPDPAGVHPEGVSPFGIRDLVGNVWQWTEEFRDEHMRSATLRGGSYYVPEGSHWYFPQAYKLTEHGKYLLLAPGKDRSGAVGFRCVKDAQ
jgi:formylglycine-generating enzyme required for sulfatase activity